MGSCLSKKAKEDPNTASLLGSKKEAEGSRDPPPTESPQFEEEKVKEVLSETPTRFVRAASSRREPAKVANGLKIEESDLGSYINAADLCSGRLVGVSANTPSESISAASTGLISENTRAEADDDDDDDEEGGTAEMKLKKIMMKKKMMSSSSVGMPRSRSPAAKTHAPTLAAAVAGKREFRGVDVGCRSGRPSPSPMRSGEMGNYARNHINSSSSYNGNVYNNTKTGDRGLMGERSVGRRMRSVSPAVSSLKSRPSEEAATKLALDHQHQQRGRHCRSLSSSMATNGRFPPQNQRIPAGALDLGARRRGQDGNPSAGGGSAGSGDGDRMTSLMEEGKEESLQNPLISMECFIFL